MRRTIHKIDCYTSHYYFAKKEARTQGEINGKQTWRHVVMFGEVRSDWFSPLTTFPAAQYAVADYPNV